MGVPPVIIHFRLGCSMINHPAIGVPPFQQTCICKGIILVWGAKHGKTTWEPGDRGQTPCDLPCDLKVIWLHSETTGTSQRGSLRRPTTGRSPEKLGQSFCQPPDDLKQDPFCFVNFVNFVNKCHFPIFPNVVWKTVLVGRISDCFLLFTWVSSLGFSGLKLL